MKPLCELEERSPFLTSICWKCVNILTLFEQDTFCRKILESYTVGDAIPQMRYACEVLSLHNGRCAAVLPVPVVSKGSAVGLPQVSPEAQRGCWRVGWGADAFPRMPGTSLRPREGSSPLFSQGRAAEVQDQLVQGVWLLLLLFLLLLFLLPSFLGGMVGLLGGVSCVPSCVPPQPYWAGFFPFSPILLPPPVLPKPELYSRS